MRNALVERSGDRGTAEATRSLLAPRRLLVDHDAGRDVPDCIDRRRKSESRALTMSTRALKPRGGYCTIAPYDSDDRRAALRDELLRDRGFRHPWTEPPAPPTDELPADNRRRETDVAQNLTDTVGAVQRFRQLFQRHLEHFASGEVAEQYASRLPEAQRAEWRDALASELVGWGMSDTYVVAIPLARVVCGRGRNPTLRSSTCSAGAEVAALRSGGEALLALLAQLPPSARRICRALLA